ncbi:MAG: MFS transporter [Flavobacteriales bacterium]|nr:MFS transporter [Flavobacteriales bacterium]MBL6872996.1 MFS transporter [Flavobacteriales bacterium]
MFKKDNKATIWSWAFYDFANSAFTTLVVTFVYGTYFTKSIAPTEIEGTQWWSWAVSLTAIVVAVTSPFLGAIADEVGARKKIMAISTFICISATALLFFPLEGQVAYALLLFVIANISFEIGTVFCNAYLPDISSEKRMGKTSGLAWGLGYLGGLIALALSLVLLVQSEAPIFGFDVDSGEHIRATNLLVAVWFLIFSLPLIFGVKEAKKNKEISIKTVLKQAFEQLKNTFKKVKDHKTIYRFLLARLFYNDALVTIFAFGGIYASTTVGFSFEEIMMLGIVLNILAGLGAFIFGYFDDRIGSKKVVNWSIVFLALACVIAILSPELPGLFELIFGGSLIPQWFNSKNLFWLAAIFIGLFSGPNQSSSRSLMARITPKKNRNEFFGFYAFSGKATAFVGPLFFGMATSYFNTQQAGLFVVILLFSCGYLFLKKV